MTILDNIYRLFYEVETSYFKGEEDTIEYKSRIIKIRLDIEKSLMENRLTQPLSDISLLKKELTVKFNQISMKSKMGKFLKEEGDELLEAIDRIYGVQQVTATSNSSDTWVDARELCNRFKYLTYNNVKDAKWRNTNNFPCKQIGKGYKVSFNVNEVQKWIDEKNIRTIA